MAENKEPREGVADKSTKSVPAAERHGAGHEYGRHKHGEAVEVSALRKGAK